MTEKADKKGKKVSDGDVPSAENIGHFIKAVINDREEDEIKKLVSEHVQAVAKKHNVEEYNIILLFDDDEITNWHSNKIYDAATSKDEKDILLILDSPGGRIEPAYLISKTCRRLAHEKFIAVIPRRAKSAATLLALGANEIHMGLMSELGPIDPQFGGLPAQSMENALSLLADLSCKYPASSEMFGKFLIEKLDLRIFGYFNRINESAVQYAERLLEGSSLPEGETPKSIADHFVNYYKDHGFVIDADEATKYLGRDVICENTKEYKFANEIYQSLDLLKFIMDMKNNKVFDYVGSIGSGLVIRNKDKN